MLEIWQVQARMKLVHIHLNLDARSSNNWRWIKYSILTWHKASSLSKKPSLAVGTSTPAVPRQLSLAELEGRKEQHGPRVVPRLRQRQAPALGRGAQVQSVDKSLSPLIHLYPQREFSRHATASFLSSS